MGPVGTRKLGDTHVFSDSDYFLPVEFVDKFAHKVKSRPHDKDEDDAGAGDDDNDDDWQDKDDVDAGGDPTDGSAKSFLETCTKNWKAASADSKKKMWGIFVGTGIFASACCHGFILWLADMVWSGELAKYALAMVGMALEVFGDKWVLGYDIGCSFNQTINNSSLRAHFNERNCRTCVNAFHGYSHNFLCQLLYHPINITGMGLEDLETLEQIFSASNTLASITRYATAFH
ncbi:hypothetical protein VKT23_019451 [Stygiomarasmius scandens]|uniref:Uncharacterized protein n=1 Tax=Marasmiellus scandens TaxID=2682957 RepID=A0ABR1INE9_9AGAR